MQLIKVKVYRFRSVEDSGEVDIQPDVTCLVGKNESGKTGFLQGLYRLAPIESGVAFDEKVDYPSRLTRERKTKDGYLRAVEATFALSAEQLQTIEAELGTGVLPSGQFTVERGYRGDITLYNVVLDEQAAVARLRHGLDLTAAGQTSVEAVTSIADLIKVLTALDEPAADVRALLARMQGWRTQRLTLHVIDEYLAPWLPKLVYFDNYDAMPGKASIPDLIRRRDAGTMTRGDRALLALLTMVGVSPEDFRDADKHEHLIREAENAANSISDEVFQYWSQNRDLRVELKILNPETDAVPPLHEGPILQVRVYNQRHRVSVSFDDRSRGFVWFFSFLAYFSELEEESKSGSRPLVLLLDEPGLSLHATAQADLLRLIEERLAPRHQVIYTTHSPFLVDPRHLERVRTVIDVDDRGTVVSSDVLRADTETGFPLQAALGYELAQSLFVGPDNLLLEGPSDLVYLDVLDHALAADGRETLNPRWVKIPVGGAGKLSTFVSLLGAHKLNLAVVMDASTKDSDAIKKLQATGRLADGALITIGEVIGRPNADVEDLLDPQLYLDLVALTYPSQLPNGLKLAALRSTDDRIVRRVEQHFTERGLGRLNHYWPAATLLRQQGVLLAQIDAATLDRVEALMRRLNELLG